MKLINKEELITLLINDGRLKGLEKIEKIKSTHGSCCNCAECGYWHDDCVCDHNTLLSLIQGLVVYNLTIHTDDTNS